MNIKKYKKAAFTLAEILVTLTIIGFVASMTIPALMQSINNAEIPVKVKKYQATLSSAVKLMMVQKGYSDLISIYPDGISFWNDFKVYLNVVKDCGNTPGQGCFAPGVTYKYLNNVDYIVFDDDVRPRGILADGVSIRIHSWYPNCANDRSISNITPLSASCGAINVDINGHKGPNQRGRDTFVYLLTKNGIILPSGIDDDTYKGCDPSSSDIDWGSDGAPGAGAGCTAKVLQEGAVNY